MNKFYLKFLIVNYILLSALLAKCLSQPLSGVVSESEIDPEDEDDDSDSYIGIQDFLDWWREYQDYIERKIKKLNS